MAQKSISAFFCASAKPKKEVNDDDKRTKTPSKKPAIVSSLDSPPVKKSRRRVARVLDDSSDDEEEKMETQVSSSKSQVNGHSTSPNKDKDKPISNGTTSTVNGHSTGTDQGDKDKPVSNGTASAVNGHSEADSTKMPSPDQTSPSGVPKRKTARKHMKKRKVSSEEDSSSDTQRREAKKAKSEDTAQSTEDKISSKDDIVTESEAMETDTKDNEKSAEEKKEVDKKNKQTKKTEKKSPKNTSKKDVDKEKSPEKTSPKHKTKVEPSGDTEEIEVDKKKKETNQKKTKKSPKNKSKKDADEEISTEKTPPKHKTKVEPSSDTEKEKEKESSGNSEEEVETKKSAFSSFFSPRQASKPKKDKEPSQKEKAVKTPKEEKKSPKTEPSNDSDESHKPVDAKEYNPEKNHYHPIKNACWKQGERVPYLAVARTFELIEDTSARLKIMSTLSNLYRSIIALTPDDLIPCVYLCLNKLAPAYEGIELGIGDHILMKAVGESTGRSIQQIKSDLADKGDLGLVAESCRSNQRTMFAPPKLTAVGVFSKLKEIALFTGHSSTGKKVDIIKGMFVACRHSEARYLIRSLSGKLRIGLAEQSVLTALAHAIVLTPPSSELPPPVLDASKNLASEEIKKLLDKGALTVKTCYCELPNYNKIIPAILEHGLDDLPNKCYLTPGVPLKPMLAHPSKGVAEVLKRFENNAFTCEYKYDGERAQIHLLENGEIHIYSRNQENNTSKYPDIISRMPQAFSEDIKSFVIDTEAVAWDREKKQILPFQILSTRKRKDADVAEIKVQVCVYAFDLLYLNGKSYVREPFSVRRNMLRTSFKEVDGEFVFAKCMTSTNTEDMAEFLEESIKGNCEGLMVKTLDVDATYEIAKRSHNWLKLKKDYLADVGDTLDLVPIGGYRGKGKRTGAYGGFLLACYDTESEEFQTICKIGTGFTDEVLETHHQYFKDHVIDKPKPYYRYDDGLEPDHWFDAVQVWEVRAADLSVSPVHKAAAGQVDPVKGISLRFPRFLRVRDDKKPEEATDSSQVAEMYRDQDSVKNNAVATTNQEEDFY